MLKEKKANVNQPANECLDALFLYVLELPDLMPCIEEGMQHKVPKVKEEVTVWLNRCLKNPAAKPAAVQSIGKPLAELMIKYSDDASAPVRNNTLEVLGSLVGLLGERPLHGVR